MAVIIIFSLILLALIILTILNLIIIDDVTKENSKCLNELRQAKEDMYRLKRFLKIKQNDISKKINKFEDSYNKSTTDEMKYANLVCLYSSYREELLSKDIEQFIEKGL